AASFSARFSSYPVATSLPSPRARTATHRVRLAAVTAPRLTVVGSINLDLVARAKRLPRPGETVSGARFSRVPGGKGANQAVAAARLGAEVQMIGCVGRDELADDALTGLRGAGVEERWLAKDAPTGIALVTVDGAGETT